MRGEVIASIAPLCPAGHLPLKGGDRFAARPHPSRGQNMKWRDSLLPISPLEGEMSGRTEGGKPRPRRESKLQPFLAIAHRVLQGLKAGIAMRGDVVSRVGTYGGRVPRISSPRRGEGGAKRRMRGHPLRISLPLPPHPAAATFSPSGRRRQDALPPLHSHVSRWARPRLLPISPLEGEMSGRTEGGKPQARRLKLAANYAPFTIRNRCPLSSATVSTNLCPSSLHICAISITASGSVVSTVKTSPAFSAASFLRLLKTGRGHLSPLKS